MVQKLSLDRLHMFIFITVAISFVLPYFVGCEPITFSIFIPILEPNSFTIFGCVYGFGMSLFFL